MAVSSSKIRQQILKPFAGVRCADTPELLAHWLRFKRDGDPESLSALVANYLPEVRMTALCLMRNRRRLFPDLAETLSIATLALYECIDSFEPEKNPGSIAGFHSYFFEWGWHKCKFLARRDRNDGKLNMPSKILGEKMRDRLTQNLGRTPTPLEVIEAFSGKIYDPKFYSRPIPQTVHASAGIERNDGSGKPFDVLGNVPSREPSPYDALLKRELKRELSQRVMRGLDKREKKILRQIMADEPICHLSDEMDVSRQRVDQIAKRLMKKLSARKSLAGYLGIKAAP